MRRSEHRRVQGIICKTDLGPRQSAFLESAVAASLEDGRACRLIVARSAQSAYDIRNVSEGSTP
ncbi:hypothetical protein RHEC894_PC00198 (plasmid) [Rhizobium sp. CIAT894]|nr:hypothetical protein IE4803_PB00231 [Rhizobium etli bv. phaseoli str. IE4803]ARM91231.1 hypothetical protein RHEC894_PC00198 [Rhizobium sp. CIAT894]